MTVKLVWFSWNCNLLLNTAGSGTFTPSLIREGSHRGLWLRLIEEAASDQNTVWLSECSGLKHLTRNQGCFQPVRHCQKRRGYRTGRERGESNKEPAWVSKSLNSQLSETTWWTARVWEAGSDARHPPWLHSTAPTRPMSRRKEMVRLHHGTYGCHAACSFLSRCSYGGCSQVVWKQLGLLQIEITGGIGVLEPALRQMAWTKQSEEKRDGRPCRKPSGGVVHREGTTTRWIWGQPLVPPPPPTTMSSSGDAVPQSLLEKSHVEFGHPSELEPRS